MHLEFEFEKKKFDSTLLYIAKYYNQICSEKSKIDANIEDALKHYNQDNLDQFNELTLNTSKHNFLSQKIKDVARSLKKPYFARVDFIPDDEKNLLNIYIGKVTLFDDTGINVLITDWRAPISTLYYEGRVGRAEYNCLEGDITGEITLKRQYLIEDGSLLDVMDIDITTNDEFLQAALGASKDRRLKDIVTTIQAEQNRIIRADMFRPMVVQGAAGGGKTTIALHRIAYLLYAFEGKLSASNFMIMAPNKFFLSYISDVLPDLGVENVIQTTFEDFALNFIGKKIRIVSALKVLANVIERGGDSENLLGVSHLKSTLKYKKLFERYYEFILKKFVPDSDFDIDGYVIIDNKKIKELMFNDYSYQPVKKRVAELKKNLDNALFREKERICLYIEAKYDAMRNEVKREMDDSIERRKLITQILDERDRKLKDVKKIIKSCVKEFLAQFKLLSVDQLYVILFKNKKLFMHLAKNIFSESESQSIYRVTLANIEKGCVEIDDIAPMMYLQLKLYGAGEKMQLKHIVIDEAQDYSLFQFSVLKDILGVNSFSVLGDLSQGIYAYRGVKDWMNVCEDIFQREVQYMALEQSYRTTIEIMDKANEVIEYLYNITDMKNIKKAKPVIRHGGEVVIEKKDGAIEIARAIDLKIKEYLSTGYRSIAIVCKTYRECQDLKKYLSTPIKIIQVGDSEYSGGVILAPSYLVKGLEFDAVIISNASEENYKVEELDIKLLYIAMTRALHELTIFYAGNPCPMLYGDDMPLK